MKLWEPQSVLCCSLRTGILTYVSIRIIMMLTGVAICITDIILIQRHDRVGNLGIPVEGETILVSIIMVGCLIALILCGLFIYGLEKNISILYMLFVLWQEIEDVVVLAVALITMATLASYNYIGLSCLTLTVAVGLFVYKRCFIMVIRSYHLEMKRRTGAYVEFQKEEGAEEQDEEEEEAAPAADT